MRTVEGEAATPRRETVTRASPTRPRVLAGRPLPAARRRPDPARHLDLRRAGRLGERHGRHAGRGRGTDLRRVERRVLAGPEGHHLVGVPRSRHRRLAGVRRPRSSPPECRSCAAASRGWPRSPTPRPGSRWPRASSSSSARAAVPPRSPHLAVFFFVFISTTVGLSAAPAAAHDVASVLGCEPVPAHVVGAAARGVALHRRRAQAGRARGAGRCHLRRVVRRAPRPRRAADHRHAVGPAPAAVGGLVAQRQRSGCWPSPLLAGARILLARRFGSTIARELRTSVDRGATGSP